MVFFLTVEYKYDNKFKDNVTTRIKSRRCLVKANMFDHCFSYKLQIDPESKRLSKQEKRLKFDKIYY